MRFLTSDQKIGTETLVDHVFIACSGQRLVKMKHSPSLSNQIGPQPIAKAKILGEEHEILFDTGSQIQGSKLDSNQS